MLAKTLSELRFAPSPRGIYAQFGARALFQVTLSLDQGTIKIPLRFDPSWLSLAIRVASVANMLPLAAS